MDANPDSAPFGLAPFAPAKSPAATRAPSSVKGRVVVAMSGGVDSSTTAALMAEQGYDVIGVTLQLYDHGQAMGRKGACCAGQDIHDARRVADRLGIAHYVLDYERRFRKSVIEDFADDYVAGLTPIPCVRCNQTVKFRDLLAMARDLGADALVTGHYARAVAGADGPELHRARDAAKDQSYFLFATTREQLDYVRFPLGELTKADTRRHAERLNLPVAKKPESQDICFVPRSPGGGSYARVVEKLRPGACEAGDIVDLAGNVLGRHQGVIHFTVGQRRGLRLAAPEPLYVVRLQPEARRVVVGPRSALAKSRFVVGDVNWLGRGPGPQPGIKIDVKVRSTAAPLPATLNPKGNGDAEVMLAEPEHGIAPGQACVFYAGDRVLGGGWIRRDPPPPSDRP